MFFGVPNRGMSISSLMPMVQGQPNQSLLLSLDRDSQLLREQQRRFKEIFELPETRYRKFKVASFYETKASNTATMVSFTFTPCER